MTSEPATGRLERLLAEASWLEGLARALVRDRDEARELVQDVWAAAAERAPARVERPRAWLAEVLRNALHSRRRSQGPREARERAQARDATTSGAGDVVARAEAQRVLVEHVLALDEPWRSTVLLRFYDDLSSEEIARRERLPASTVRNRLARALELLRARLERGQGTSWLSGMLVLARGNATGAGADTSPAAASLGAGILIGIVVLATSGVLWWSRSSIRSEPAARLARDRSAAAPRGEASGSAARGGSARVARREEVGAAESEPLAPDAAGEPESALPAGTFEGRVLENDAPCRRRGSVECAWNWLPHAFDAPEGVKRIPLESDGTFRFDGLAVGSYGIRLDLDGAPVVNTGVFVPPQNGIRREILLGDASIGGTVWDEQGLPASGARLVLTWSTAEPDQERTVLQETFLGTCDLEGRYRFEGLAAGRYGGGLERVGGEEQAAMRKLHFMLDPWLASGEDRHLDLGVPRPWPRWSGVLRAQSGDPHLGGARLSLSSKQLQLVHDEIEVEADGRFEFPVAPGRHALEVMLDERESRRVPLGEVEVVEDLVHDLVLPGARVRGRVYRMETGAALTGTERYLTLGVRREGESYPGAVRHACMDARAGFAIDALEPGVYLLNAQPLVVDGVLDSLRFELRPGEDELVLEVGVRAP